MKKNSEYKINPSNTENIYVVESIDIYPLKRLSELILPKWTFFQWTGYFLYG